MDVRYFESPAALRAWFEEHHQDAHELWVGSYRKGTGRPSVTYAEAVDQALCFGWIDGVRRKVDAERYANRFTPRRVRSVWSAVNIARVEELTRLGLMHPAGRAAFERRDDVRSKSYSHEQQSAELDEASRRTFQANAPAWAFFEAQPPSYRRVASWWVISAKRAETRQRRLATLIEDSEQGRRIALVRRPERPSG